MSLQPVINRCWNCLKVFTSNCAEIHCSEACEKDREKKFAELMKSIEELPDDLDLTNYEDKD